MILPSTHLNILAFAINLWSTLSISVVVMNVCISSSIKFKIFSIFSRSNSLNKSSKIRIGFLPNFCSIFLISASLKAITLFFCSPTLEYSLTISLLIINSISSCWGPNRVLPKSISREILLGKTRFGPQHDDIEFIINKEIVKEYSSVGEQKNSVIAFKLAEIKNIEQKLGKKPILILDDLFSELDREKIENILNLMDDDMQTFITTTEIDKVDQRLIAKAKIFKCVDGKIIEEWGKWKTITQIMIFRS